jgi:hypothetical protein
VADHTDAALVYCERSQNHGNAESEFTGYFEATTSGVASAVLVSVRGFAHVNICWKRSLEM